MIASVLQYYRVCVLAGAAVLIFGVYTYLNLPRTEDPEFDVDSCQVVTLWPGVTAGKIENLVTRPLEEAIEELDDIGLIESVSSAGVSLITIDIEPPGIPGEVVEAIERQVGAAQRDLPDGVLAPEVLTFNTSGIPVIIASLQGSDDYNVLNQWADRLEDELASLDEVAAVEIEGMPERQIQVVVDNGRLSQYRIPLTQIRDIVAMENAASPGGKLDVGSRRFLLNNPNEYRSLEAMEETVIGSVEDSMILLRDVAYVVDGFADDTYRARTNRRPALLVAVSKKERTNTIAVAEAVVSRIDDFKRTLPEGFDLTIVSNRGASVDQLLGDLQGNAIGGGVIVILMTTLFLGARQALVISLSIPLSILIAFILMDVTSLDLNQVSIFGLVLALGMLVDSAMVVVENIAIHLERGKALFTAVVDGVDQVMLAVISSALTTVAAFVPLLFLTGDIGAFIYSLPLTVMYALGGSVLVSLTGVPLLCYALWKRFPPSEPTGEQESAITDRYAEVAKLALRNRLVTLALATVVFVVAVGSIPRLGVQFFPKAEKKFFLINIRLPRDVNFDTTDRVAARVEEMLAEEPAIDNVTMNIGKGSPRIYYNEAREAADVSYAQALVNLRPEFEGSVDDYVAELQTKLRRISGATVEPKILEQGPAGGAAIQVRVSGNDLDTLGGVAAEILQRIADVPGVTDLRDTMGERLPRLMLDLDKQEAALLGVDTFTFSTTVFLALNGQVASYYRDDTDEIPIVVRLDKQSVQDVSDLDRIYLPSRFNEMVPFAELSTVQHVSEFGRINRRDGQRVVTVESEVGNRLVDDVVADIRAKLTDIPLPPQVTLEFGGESEERDASFAGLGQALGLAFLLIYGILAIQFNSFVQPFVILLTVPFGIIGAVAGLFVSGNPFGFMAFIGIVSLTGIIINDAIVLTDYANYLQRVEGKGMYQSLLEAGQRRFRPVILTSLTTMGGMAPLAIWGGSIWSPLANALIFGLGSATVLTLIILPVIYSLLVHQNERHRVYRLSTHLWQKLWRKETPSASY